MEYQVSFHLFKLILGQLEHEIRSETSDISLYGLIQVACRHLIQFRQVKIQNHALTANLMNLLLYDLYVIHLVQRGYPRRCLGVLNPVSRKQKAMLSGRLES